VYSLVVAIFNLVLLSALMLLVGQQEGNLAWEKPVQLMLQISFMES